MTESSSNQPTGAHCRMGSRLPYRLVSKIDKAGAPSHELPLPEPPDLPSIEQMSGLNPSRLPDI